MAKRFSSHLFSRLALATAVLILTSFPVVLSIIMRCHTCQSERLHNVTMGTSQCPSQVHCFGHNTRKRQCTKVVPARFARCLEIGCGTTFPTNPTEICNADHTIPCDSDCLNGNPSNHHMADVINGDPPNNHMADGINAYPPYNHMADVINNVNPPYNLMADFIDVNPPINHMAAPEVIDLPDIDLNEMPPF